MRQRGSVTGVRQGRAGFFLLVAALTASGITLAAAVGRISTSRLARAEPGDGPSGPFPIRNPSTDSALGADPTRKAPAHAIRNRAAAHLAALERQAAAHPDDLELQLALGEQLRQAGESSRSFEVIAHAYEQRFHDPRFSAAM